jgi:flagellar motor component MotA
VLASVARGELAPGQGAALLGAIGTLARVSEIDELAARVAALEERNAKP